MIPPNHNLPAFGRQHGLVGASAADATAGHLSPLASPPTRAFGNSSPPRSATATRAARTSSRSRSFRNRANRKTRLEGYPADPRRRIYRAARRGATKPTVKQHLAAIRMLFDWLVTGQVMPIESRAGRPRPQAFGQERQNIRALGRGDGPAARVDRRRHAHRPPRSRAHCAHGLHLRPRRRGRRHEGRGLLHSEAPRLGAAPRKGRQGDRAPVPRPTST